MDNSSQVSVPKVPWDYDMNQSQVMDMVGEIMEHGYNSRSKFFDLIAYHGSEWKSQDLPEYWSIRALAVLTYLDWLEGDSPDIIIPKGLKFNKGQLSRPYDYVKLLFHVSHKWRVITPDDELWTFLSAMEFRIGATRRQLWQTPNMHITDLQKVCDIYAIFFTVQYFFYTVLDSTKEPAFKTPENVTAWMQGQINITKRARITNSEIQRLYMRSSLFPGEDDAHARFECGVFSSGYRDVLESQRPNVSADAIWDHLHEFDTDGACGILKFYIISIIIKRTCQYDWVENNLFIDQLITSEVIQKLEGRSQPWIVLICNTYFIREPRKLITYYTTSSEEAIYTWFKLFWEQGEEEFFDGNDLYDMTRLPHTCPLSKKSIDHILS